MPTEWSHHLKRVVVTGIGLVTPLGCSKEIVWKNVSQGISGISHLKWAKYPFPVKIGAQVGDFEPDPGDSGYDRFIQFALSAARQAVKDAGLAPDRFNRGLALDSDSKERTGVLISSSKGGVSTFEKYHSRLLGSGPSSIPKNLWFNINQASASQAVSKLLSSPIDSIGDRRLEGPSYGIVSACATGAHSIISASHLISEGRADLMIAGSSDASLTPLILGGFSKMGALSQKASRPFDAERDGFVLGEGCGIVVLESLEGAKRRKASIYGEILSTVAMSEAHHVSAIEPGGKTIGRAVQLAIQRADLSAKNIDYVNAHATGTVEGDIAETLAMKRALGENAYSVAISSTKSMMGHLLGAAGSVEFIVSLLCMENNYVHPTINLENIDPQCDLDYTPNEGAARTLKNIMSLSYGFGGHIAVLIAGKPFSI